MRTRLGNPFREAHGQAMRVYDWIAPVGTDPHDAAKKAEVALGVKLFGDTGEMQGYVNTSRRPDGSLYVAVCLYDVACSDAACPGGHGSVAIRQAPPMTVVQLTTAKAAVGEHATHRLGIGQDAAVLAALGFGSLA